MPEINLTPKSVVFIVTRQTVSECVHVCPMCTDVANIKTATDRKKKLFISTSRICTFLTDSISKSLLRSVLCIAWFSRIRSGTPLGNEIH